METVHGDEETLFEYNLKLVGRHRFVNGTIIHHVDLDEDYEIWIDIWILKNGNWTPNNISLRHKPCHFMKNIFASYFEPSLLDSNVPKGDDKCPFRKGEYYVKNVELNTESWSIFINRGLNKCRVSIKRNGTVVGGLTVVMDLVDRGT
ncbi:GL17155 [Drosophila persimilis]|uniref:GL17155 n=1 Tax=Drosophila persimilis TaxID=7234 RepID=B4GGD4_DROPE|nr:GL17155 [Drosophila persimilis]